jgi:hypothetical protein
VSVFLEVPEETWSFANALAFAFRDRFPVAPAADLEGADGRRVGDVGIVDVRCPGDVGVRRLNAELS